MASKPSIVAEVTALIPERPGVRPWWDRLDQKQAALAAEILAAWKAGAFGSKRRPAATAIATALRRHGVEIGFQGVDTWLRRLGK
jgi:hypothetical protein